MKELNHTPSPWILKGDQIISEGVKNIDWNVFGKKAPMGAPDITLICTLPMQMNYKDAPHNARLIAAAPEMLDALIYEYRNICLNCGAESCDSGRQPAGKCGERMRKVIEAATNTKISEVLA